MDLRRVYQHISASAQKGRVQQNNNKQNVKLNWRLRQIKKRCSTAQNRRLLLTNRHSK